MTLDVWLQTHPYLQPVADLQRQVERAMDEVLSSKASPPQWESYAHEYHSGVPLLLSSTALIDFGVAENALRAYIQRLCSSPLQEAMARQVNALCVELCSSQDAPRHAISWLLGTGSFTTAQPGLLLYLGWTILSRYLAPTITAFDEWRSEKKWLRAYCPTCGSPPAMARLVGVDPGCHRYLICGCCRTWWRFRRLGCGFCENEDDTRLGVIGLEQEGGLRVDYCQVCSGYLKTYCAEGSEAVMLADWTSLHLDVLAHDRGLKRLAGSLYQM